MEKEKRMMKGIRSHVRAVTDIIAEDNDELFTEPQLRAAASQCAEAHRMLERLIGRMEVNNERARAEANRIGGDNDPMKYVAAA